MLSDLQLAETALRIAATRELQARDATNVAARVARALFAVADELQALRVERARQEIKENGKTMPGRAGA